MTAALVAGIFTVGAICVVEGYLLFGRFQYLANRADETADNSDKAIAKVDELVEKLWQAYEAHMPPAPEPEQPETEPIPAQPGPETVPTHEALTVQAVIDSGPRPEDDGREHDRQFARILADLDDFVFEMDKRDAERKARAA